MSLVKLKNIGPKTDSWLAEIGITSPSKLRSTPLDKIYYQLKQKGFPANLTLVYALDAALNDEHLMMLSEERKEDLRQLIENSSYMEPEDCMKSLQSLTNIGKQMSSYLYESGIKTPKQFRDMGFELVWKKLIKTFPKLTTHPAYKMAVLGAFQDKPWNDVELN